MKYYQSQKNIYQSQGSSVQGSGIKKSKSMFPILDNIPSSPRKLQKSMINYNVMLNLPFIVKEKSILERKNTIDVFKKKKVELLQGSKKDKKSLLNSGRIYINEFWSEKYQQSVLQETKIQNQLDQIQALMRKNMSQLIDEVHDIVEVQGSRQNEITAYNEMVLEYRKYQSNKQNPHNFGTDNTIPSQALIFDIEASNNQHFYKRSQYHLKGKGTQISLFKKSLFEPKDYQPNDDSQQIDDPISIIPKLSSTQGDMSEQIGKDLHKYKTNVSELIKQCVQAQHPKRNFDKLELKYIFSRHNRPWLQNSQKHINPESGFKIRSLNRSETKRHSIIID